MSSNHIDTKGLGPWTSSNHMNLFGLEPWKGSARQPFKNPMEAPQAPDKDEGRGRGTPTRKRILEERGGVGVGALRSKNGFVITQKGRAGPWTGILCRPSGPGPETLHGNIPVRGSAQDLWRMAAVSVRVLCQKTVRC